MIINLKLRDIVQDIEFYLDFSKRTMGAKTAYKFSKILKQVIEEYNSYNTVKQSLFQRYANKDENNQIIYKDNNVSMNDENYTAYLKELEDLLETPVEINFIPLNLEELEGMDFTPSLMTVLSLFIQEE